MNSAVRNPTLANTSAPNPVLVPTENLIRANHPEIQTQDVAHALDNGSRLCSFEYSHC